MAKELILSELFLEQSPSYYPNIKLMNPEFKFEQFEIETIRSLADVVAEIASRPEMQIKKKLWTDQNDLKTDQPLIFADPEVGWNEIIPASSLLCSNALARTWEMLLRKQIFWGKEMKDDKVVESFFDLPFVFSDDGWGIDVKKTGGGDGGAFHIEAALSDYDTDFEKLHFPKIEIDWEMTGALTDYAERILGDILPVRRKHTWHWDISMVEKFVLLRGMEEFMCDFVTEPDNIHRMMSFIIDGMQNRLDWMENEGLLTLNSDSTYIGTGGQGFTSQLPSSGFSGKVKTVDLWGSVQAQETVSINPDMYGEFILPYHQQIAERFGLTCYGCCEPYNPRWKYIKQIPHLRRVSCSPWADFTTIPENLGKNYVATVKLIPTPLSVPNMNEDTVRKDCRHAVEATKGAICEFIMKDNHTLGGKARNLTRWVEIMREEIDRVYG